MKISKDWLVGFVDGEGTFFVGINKGHHGGYHVLPEFVITQHKRDKALLYAIRKYFNCGVVREQTHREICYLRVRKLEHLSEIIVPFFTHNALLTVKKFDFFDFKRVIQLMVEGRHLDDDGFAQIVKMKGGMNRGRLLDEDIVPSLLKDKE